MVSAAVGVGAGSFPPLQASGPPPSGQQPDVQVWVPAIRAGDVAAFEALFRTLYAPLTHYLHKAAGPDVAEELAQDVFVAVWRRRERLDPARPVRAYLFRAARNAAVNHVRRQRVEERALDRMVERGAFTPPAEGAAARELEGALEAALEDLPPRCRQVFVLSRRAHLTHAQIARRLGLSVKTVENHLGRALRHLRLALVPFLD